LNKCLCEIYVGFFLFQAIIASNGKLTKNFEYIDELRHANRSRHKAALSVGQKKQKQALVLGAGYVSSPLVEYLSREGSDIQVTVASALKDEADALARTHPKIEPVLLDVIGRPDLLGDLIGKSDVVVSLLPYRLHPKVKRRF